MRSITARISKEIELHLIGNAVPYIPASGPSFSSGGEPAEGGYCEDVDIEDITISVHDPAKDHKDPEKGLVIRGYKEVSILDGVDLDNAEVKKLFANIYTLLEDDAQEALAQNMDEDYEPECEPEER